MYKQGHFSICYLLIGLNNPPQRHPYNPWDQGEGVCRGQQCCLPQVPGVLTHQFHVFQSQPPKSSCALQITSEPGPGMEDSRPEHLPDQQGFCQSWLSADWALCLPCSHPSPRPLPHSPPLPPCCPLTCPHSIHSFSSWGLFSATERARSQWQRKDEWFLLFKKWPWEKGERTLAKQVTAWERAATGGQRQHRRKSWKLKWRP